MPLITLKNKPVVPPVGFRRVLGLDVGDARTGIAIADPITGVATPLQVLVRQKFTKDAQVIQSLIAEHEIDLIILGLPVNMDGTPGPRVQSVRDFGIELERFLAAAGHTVQILMWDERLSTQAVDNFLVSSVDMSRKRRGEVVDKLAAQFILQGAVDYLSRHN